MQEQLVQLLEQLLPHETAPGINRSSISSKTSSSGIPSTAAANSRNDGSFA
jgi:hypothetical protein